ncbi:putative ankyrin repeat-containing domain-containing protein [Plasmopara halstedii]
MTDLNFACMSVCPVTQGHSSMVQFLLSWDPDSRLRINSPDIQGIKPLYALNKDNVRAMLKVIRFQPYLWTFQAHYAVTFQNLWIESYNGNDTYVRKLLLSSPHSSDQWVVSINEKTVQTERTPLHLAIQGYVDVLQSPELARHPSSITHQCVKQQRISELRITASSRYLKTAIFLLQAGANLCATDKWGITSLMLAATIKVFIDSLLNQVSEEKTLLVIDVNGNTALHYSYAFCQAHVCLMLEDLMDNPYIENDSSGSLSASWSSSRIM